MRIILASKSPRRRELMNTVFDDVQVVTKDVEERCSYARPSKIVTYLATVKMADIDSLYPDACVVSGDTIVYYDGKVYGKPAVLDGKFFFDGNELCGGCRQPFWGKPDGGFIVG